MVRRKPNTEPPSTAWLHWFLAKQLRRYREMAGQTQTAMADTACVSIKHYFSFETAERLPTRDTVKVLDAALGARGALVEIREEMTESPHSGWFGRLLAMESHAVEIWQYEPQVVPGLLQTEAYGLSVLNSAPRQNFTRSVDEDLATRLARQSIVSGPDAPQFWFVLDEAILLRRPRDPDVMVDQLTRLLNVADLSNVTLQVLPLSCGLHAMLEGSCTILKFGGYGSDDVVYLEPVGQGLLAYDPETVLYSTRRFDLLRAEALSPAETARLLRSNLESL